MNGDADGAADAGVAPATAIPVPASAAPSTDRRRTERGGAAGEDGDDADGVDRWRT